MTVSKEVKDIIEGVFTFLTCTLKSENLSENADVLRKKLLAQIKKFAQTNQTFRIYLRSDEIKKSFDGICGDNQSNWINGMYRLSTSSGSTNYSMGFSGDDATSSPQTLLQDTSSAEDDDDFYEEFEENNEYVSLQNSSNGGGGSCTSKKCSNETKSNEDSYTIVKNIPFRNLIARCDRHGIINKRFKSFLKSSRYFGVIADCLLHLYHKESDNKPKRVIDLKEYTVRCNTFEDNKKKKEFCFELISPGKKTHTFTVLTDRERHDWVDTLNRAINTNSCNGSRNQNTSGNDVSSHNNESDICFQPSDTINDQRDCELYEEIMEKEMPYQRFHNTYNNEQSKYYEVPLEESDIDIKTFGLPLLESTPNKKLTKPDRPPLPDILRQKIDQSRPLPPEPDVRSSGESSYDPSIYWEIENESSFEVGDENDLCTRTRSLHSRSLSQEIFDTIKDIVPNLPDDCQAQLTSSEEHIVGEEEYEIPSDIHLPMSDTGITDQFDFGNNSLYQIPTNSWKVCDIYEIPPTPVPILAIKPIESVAICKDNYFNDTTSEFSKCQTKHTKSDYLNGAYDYDSGRMSEEIKLEKPLGGVRELVRKLNERQSKSEMGNIRKSETKLSAGKVNGEGKCFLNHKYFSPLVHEGINSRSENNDVVTISIQSSDCLPSTVDIKTGIFTAKFAYVRENPNELSFSRGDTIVVIDTSQNTWWECELHGKKGFVRKDYLRRSDS